MQRARVIGRGLDWFSVRPVAHFIPWEARIDMHIASRTKVDLDVIFLL